MTFNELSVAIEETMLTVCNCSEFKLFKMKFEQRMNKYGKVVTNYKAPILDFHIDLEVNGEYQVQPIFIQELEH